MNRLNSKNGSGIPVDRFLDEAPANYKRTSEMGKFVAKDENEWVIAQKWIRSGEPDVW